MSAFDDWSVGTDTGSGKITRIFHKNSNFMIYELNNSGWFIYNCKEEIGTRFSGIQTEWTDAMNLINFSREKSRYVGKFSGALKECLLGNIDSAKEKLIVIKKSVIDYKTTMGRTEYLGGAFLTGLLFSTILFATASFVDLGRVKILKIIFCGIMGGLLSVCINIKSVVINPNSGSTWINLIAGATRVIISTLSSFIIYLLIQGQFILGIVKDANDHVFYALGIVSGFSEAFIPDLLKKVKASTSIVAAENGESNLEVKD